MAIPSTPAPTNALILAFTGPRRLDYLSRPGRDPDPDEVRVETCFSGISHGTEMNVYRGQAPQWTKRYDPNLRLFQPATDEQRPSAAEGDHAEQ